MTRMVVPMNVGQTMERNLPWTVPMDNILKLGYHNHYVMEAIARINAAAGIAEITERNILEQLLKIKKEKNLTDEQMKIPTRAAELRRENDKMLGMLLCKSCKKYRGTFVNIECGHLLCSNCCEKLTACKLCGEKITNVQLVKFAE